MEKTQSPCILWEKAKDRAGYGVSWENGKYIRAHRKVYKQYYGEIPPGFFVCHTCDVRACVNPKHLFLGTPKQNSEDMVIKKRQAFGTKVKLAKLSEEEVILIRQSSLSSRELSKIFKVSKSTILSVKSQKTWKHL